MSRNLRARIDKLERRTTTSTSRRIRIWDVLLGQAMVEELDEADRQTLRQVEADRREARRQHPAMLFLRKQWARLGMADPGDYDGPDLIEEALRLAAIPTPSALPSDVPQQPANEPAPREPS
jgi:hypothetical protein